MMNAGIEKYHYVEKSNFFLEHTHFEIVIDFDFDRFLVLCAVRSIL